MAAPVTNPAPPPAAAEAVGGRAPRAPRVARHRGDGVVAWLFLAPYLALFGTFVLAPIVLGIWISLHSWDFTLPGKPFVGLDNYADLFDPDSVSFDPFWNSMQATGIFTLFSVPLLIVVPLAVALVMNEKFRGRNLFRAIYFAPYVLGVAVVGVMWRFLLDRNIGAVNSYLDAVGLPGDTAWLSSVPAAWVALVGVTVWWTLGFNAVIYIAGLQDIPRELYEAAEIDGASRWASFRHVTLPGLRPVTMFVTLVTVIASANMFGQSFIMTNGAPARETQTAIFYIAETGLQNFQMGQAAAASWILTLALMLLSVVVFAVFRARGQVSES
ncbi:ABC transporter permease subunit [Nocardioides sp. zg-579]|uniref:ABC transporter permease subunit n=1 Tax=Nocardioides marmotae TaxID=2663857 RepID=A0A6I3J0N5_9ACTN|nr:sugar ABC transporter permease [Nocardioides marmotae]MCR6031418.1 ABC transporter permease subunit [Gordonia jinghuaiqii]MTB95057.1 ABC transporter permease subunit [Nocardioides marmotae]QKE02446.1 sugar ABC transporter permease [Nocardioides marmotae]